jgi:hypothetical protein
VDLQSILGYDDSTEQLLLLSCQSLDSSESLKIKKILEAQRGRCSVIIHMESKSTKYLFLCKVVSLIIEYFCKLFIVLYISR